MEQKPFYYLFAVIATLLYLAQPGETLALPAAAATTTLAHTFTVDLGQPSTGDLGYHPRGVIVRREELRNTNVTDSPTAKSNNGSLAHSDAVHIVVGLCIVIILATLLTFWKYIRMRGVFDFMNHRVYHSPCRPTKGYTPPIVPVVRTASLDSNSSKTTTLVAVEEKQKKDVYLTPLPAVVIVGRDSRRRL